MSKRLTTSLCFATIHALASAAGSSHAAPPEVGVDILHELRAPDFECEITLTPGAWFEPNDRYVVVAKGRTLSVWHVAPRLTAPMAQAELAGKGAVVSMFGLALSDQGDTIATLADDGTLRVWTANLTPLSSLETAPEKDGFGWSAAVGVSQKGTLVARTAQDGADARTRVRVFDYMKKNEVVSFEVGSARSHVLRFSPDSRFLLVLGDSHASVWDLASGKVVDRVASATRSIGGAAFSAKGDLWFVHDGARIVARTLAGTTLFELATDLTPGPSNQIFVDAAGTWLTLTSGSDLRRWDLTTKTLTGSTSLPGLATVTHLARDGATALAISTSVVRVAKLTWP